MPFAQALGGRVGGGTTSLANFLEPGGFGWRVLLTLPATFCSTRASAKQSIPVWAPPARDESVPRKRCFEVNWVIFETQKRRSDE